MMLFEHCKFTSSCISFYFSSFLLVESVFLTRSITHQTLEIFWQGGMSFNYFPLPEMFNVILTYFFMASVLAGKERTWATPSQSHLFGSREPVEPPSWSFPLGLCLAEVHVQAGVVPGPRQLPSSTCDGVRRKSGGDSVSQRDAEVSAWLSAASQLWHCCLLLSRCCYGLSAVLQTSRAAQTLHLTREIWFSSHRRDPQTGQVFS